MAGEALPFPPVENGWMAWSGDGNVDLEVVPRGYLIHRGEDEGGWYRVENAQRLSEVHLAISTGRPKEGWPARVCPRGNGFFELVEVWVEGVFMLEMLDPVQAAHYERVVTVENLKKYLPELA